MEPGIVETYEGIPDTIALPCVKLLIKDSPGMGRGVFAGECIPYGTIIHISPVLLFPQSTNSRNIGTADSNPERAVLSHYTYTWGENMQALALGLGSMFNHTRRNNIGFTINRPQMNIRYTTTRAVEIGEELFINYGPHLWFDDDESSDSSSDASDEASDDDNLLLKSLFKKPQV